MAMKEGVKINSEKSLATYSPLLMVHKQLVGARINFL
jgi:hypothetical protein